ncbi:hypothetical protein Csa_002623 [Cucumis sativus]|uniref:Uncharacterized protein n=1 Tax=Cucumis sativus TaxID=3659 RepID=A0A0A0L9R9_CUCSA|nr:hypothetical protein Csa_002623 [Cucumis sativus]
MSQRTSFPRKPTKRRSHTRKVPTEAVINMAEARRQIAEALQLHRSSLSSSSSTTTSMAEPSGCYVFQFEKKPIVSGSQHFCYSIMESMPVPQPTWSTTEPSVVRSPVAPMEEQEIFEWGDGQASYAWWLGFLKALDVNISNDTEYENAGSGSAVGMSSMVLTRCQDGLESGEALFLEASDHTSLADEWLIIPIGEDGGFIDNNCLGNDLASN